MATVKENDVFINDYFISEGNKLGALPAEFGEDLALNEKQLKAGADCKKGQVVEITGDLEVSPTSASSAKVLGVAMFDAKAGEPVAVECEGLFKMIASAAINAGDHVVSAADGKVATGSDNPVGIAISNASAADEYVFVKFSI